VKPGTAQPAGRCPTCGNYYCAKCADIKPPSVFCPKCNDNLTYHIEAESDVDIYRRFKYGTVSIRGINTIYSFKLEMNRDVEGLIKAFKHRDSGIRADAAEALGNIRDARAVEPLIQALKDEDKYVRSGAAYALGEIADLRAVEPLTQAMKDKDVWEAAKYALEKIRAKKTENASNFA